MLTASADRTVGQWDVASGEEPLALILKHPGRWPPWPSFRIVRKRLRSATTALVRLWDIDKATMLGTLGGDEGTSQIGVSADGRLALWVNYKQRTVRVWNFHDKREVASPRARGRPEGRIPHACQTA